MLKIDSTITLNDSFKMPLLGFGAYRVEDNSNGERVILQAIDAGYRHIDTASGYQNESAIGLALKRSPIPREKLFITSKVMPQEQGRDETPRAIEQILDRLQTDYLDLLLIHWPHDEKMAACWDAMQKAVSQKKVKSIGVSNFTCQRFKTFDTLCTGATPAVNQVEFHTFFQQKELQKECRNRGIVLSGYCPLARAKKLDDPILSSIAEKHRKLTSQVMIRWSLQQNVPTIPKTSSESRIRQNADVFDFQLDQDDLNEIDRLCDTFESNLWRPDHEVFY